MLNLDTHVLLFALTDQLKPKERALLARETWCIASIVLWEISKLAQLGRVALDVNDRELNRTLSSIHTWPLTWEVCRVIPGLDFRGDPADEIIAATSIVHGIPLLTRDRAIRRSRSVPLA